MSSLVPDLLWELYTSSSIDAVEFQRYVRTYNNTLSFTSLEVKYDKQLCKNDKGIYTFKAQGQMYHYLNSLLPTNDHPSYLQLYFYDTEHEIDNIMRLSEKLNPRLLEVILKILTTNPYCRFFRNLKDVSEIDECQIIIRRDPQLDQRVYNAPIVSQVAAILVEGAEGSESTSRDIIVHSNHGSSHRVQYYYGCFDPLQYPLFFPLGESGWHQGIEKNVQRLKVSNSHFDQLDPIAVDSVDQLLSKESKGIYVL